MEWVGHNQLRTVEHKETNSGRVFIAKNRNGPDGLVYPIFMDTQNVKIDILPQTESFGEIKEKATRKQERVLSEKYKQFRKNSRKKRTQ